MDRNSQICAVVIFFMRSLSARRAWIEIRALTTLLKVFLVALRKESVDRNVHRLCRPLPPCGSLSARRAWIEITGLGCLGPSGPVALRKESVDRNDDKLVQQAISDMSLSARRAWIEIYLYGGAQKWMLSRSPQGERG